MKIYIIKNIIKYAVIFAIYYLIVHKSDAANLLLLALCSTMCLITAHITLKYSKKYNINVHYLKMCRLQNEQIEKLKNEKTFLAVSKLDCKRLREMEIQDDRFQIEDELSGWSTLIYAATYNNDPQVAVYLLEKGVNINNKAKNGFTALLLASCFNVNSNMVETLIECGANIEDKDSYGCNSLIFAAEYNANPDILKCLIKSGIHVNHQDDFGRSALHSIISTNLEKFEILIKAGANLYLQDKNGMTPLMLSVKRFNNRFRCTNLIKFLVDNGANTGLSSKENKKAYDYALENTFLKDSERETLLNILSGLKLANKAEVLLFKNNINYNRAEIEDICVRYGIECLSIFGSLVRNEFNSNSDIDIVVKRQSNQNDQFDIWEMERELSELFHRDIDLINIDSIENPIRRNLIISESEILYGKI